MSMSRAEAAEFASLKETVKRQGEEIAELRALVTPLDPPKRKTKERENGAQAN